MTNVDLQSALYDVDESLKKLSEQRSFILSKIREAQFTEQQERVARWDLKKGDCLLMFSKSSSSFYVAKTIKITDVDDGYYYTITGEYMTALGGTEFRCHDDKPISHAGLKDLEDKFTIYVVDEVQYSLFIQQLCELTISEENIQTYADAYLSAADRVIS